MALNDFGFDSITYKDHISKYDGLPTKDKLKIKGVNGDFHESINNKKQEYTVQLLENTMDISDRLVSLFKQLKSDGYIINVASNAILYTVQLILFKLGIMRYVDYVISNEDVKYGKPHSEMYLKCMLRSYVSPSETMIIEDSYVGRKGAFNSGAHLFAVNNCDEVVYEDIIHHVNKFNDIKQKWNGNKMNILIPMAGAGSRFSSAGYTFPKPLIDVHGKPMIHAVVENLNIDATYIYIVQKSHYEKYNLQNVLNVITPNCKIVQVDGITEGAACTTLLAKEFIDSDEQLLIANSDQWIQWDSSDFMYSMQGGLVDGGVVTFKNTHPKWSYVSINDNGAITEIREKEVISDDATVGIYHWKKGSDYVKYAEQMISKNIRVNNEFYVAPVYNEAISDGKLIKPYVVEKMYGIGTPEDLTYFLSTVKF
jgi:HAD superfamily hydrolase (TIGR01509 family)